MARCLKVAVKNGWRTGLVFVAVLLMMNSAKIRADILLELVVAGIPTSDGNFLYVYDVTVTQGSVLHSAGGGANTNVFPSNNFFTLYDVPGLVQGTITYGGTLTIPGVVVDAESDLGDTAPLTMPPDDPDLLNINVYWTGPDVAVPVDIPLGTFSFLSTNAIGSGALFYTAATQRLGNLGAVMNNIGQVAGPGTM